MRIEIVSSDRCKLTKDFKEASVPHTRGGEGPSKRTSLLRCETSPKSCCNKVLCELKVELRIARTRCSEAPAEVRHSGSCALFAALAINFWPSDMLMLHKAYPRKQTFSFQPVLEQYNS